MKQPSGGVGGRTPEGTPEELVRAQPARLEPEFTVEYLDPRDLKGHPQNWRQHPEIQREALRESVAEFGYLAAPIWNRRSGHILDGHARVELAVSSEERLIPVRVIDVPEGQEKRILAAFDRIGELRERDDAALTALLQELAATDAGLPAGWGEADLAALLSELEPESGLQPGVDPDALPEQVETRCQAGDLWQLGAHRLLCGDCTKADAVSRLWGTERAADVMVTDPPYCSGGFQESGRSKGSIGSDPRIKRTIANDTLSTRGYIALMKAAIGSADVAAIYVFTDWRMWVNLFDVAESSGYGVRNMIVWDKGSPGMGVGWRAQHELILFATRATLAFDNHKAQGNVIGMVRTGNPLHPTQKPVELITTVLAVTDMARTIYDPFAGSGTTLIACEQMGRPARCVELDPRHCDVILSRWEAATGREAARLD